MEEWRVVTGFPDYAVSSIGRVKRLTAACGTWPGRLLTPSVSRGYQHVTLRNDGGSVSVRIHVALCTAFHGPRPGDEYDAAHDNGRSTDNRVDNVRWATKSDNQIDRVAHGTDLRGSKVAGAILTEQQVSSIRRSLKKGAVQRHLASAFAVSPSTIHLINNGKTWRHVV